MTTRWVKIRHAVERPIQRVDGCYRYSAGKGPGGKYTFFDMTREELVEHCRQLFGDGVLLDDGVELAWEQDREMPT